MMQIKPIKIAILAMGGEGGGVLADWIVSLGEHNNYIAQTTSVPGVAQRTGATIYYIELYPKSAVPMGMMPVLALMPMPGDVDVVLASELMEAGRAVQRGLVTPNQTTLITSSHRVYSINEKSALGDGRVDSEVLIKHTQLKSKQYIKFDMAKVAEQTGSVISAVLFGALAASGAVPFNKQQFEETIERGGVGIKASLRAFNKAFEITTTQKFDDKRVESSFNIDALAPNQAEIVALLAQVKQFVPELAQEVTVEGIRRLIDYQSIQYAGLYLRRLIDSKIENPILYKELARYLALWMSYEDAIRVADLKTRASRFERVKNELLLEQEQLLDINEYMHPRVEEISDILPWQSIANWLLNPKSLGHSLVKKLTTEGKVVKTTSVRGFLLLYFLSKLKKSRHKSLRYQLEQERIIKWLNIVETIAQKDVGLALEIVQLQRLVKGYGDTYVNGIRNFNTVISVLEQHRERISAQHIAQLREAALADEEGKQLVKVIGILQF